jgi:hypothetical protein
LKKALSRAWDDCLNGVLQDIGRLKEETREKMAAIAEIKTSNQ